MTETKFGFPYLPEDISPTPSKWAIAVTKAVIEGDHVREQLLRQDRTLAERPKDLVFAQRDALRQSQADAQVAQHEATSDVIRQKDHLQLIHSAGHTDQQTPPPTAS